ncbi:lanthionine synthetase C family protein [Metabacillus niabensis]|uniref:lanthionine synthetase C family protein n=1 Tax=Metabacillus niabensis TaxID=324854 RepID=UPI0039A282E1
MTKIIELDKNPEYIIQKITNNIIHTLGTPQSLIEYTKQHDDYKTQNVDFTLASGISGLLSLLSQLKKNDNKWDEYCYQCMIIINEEISQGKVNNLSLWGGLTGIASAAYLISDKGRYYSNFITQLNELIIENLPTYLTNAYKNMSEFKTTNLDFETIYGLSGILRYLLLFRNEPKIMKIIKQIIDYLIQQNKKIEYDGQQLPGCFITKNNQLNNDKLNFPGGHLDLGLSHGICGPLAVMSLAIEYGIEQLGQRETINTIVNELLLWAQEDQYGVWWPGKISLKQYINRTISETQPSIYGWCYGTPGVARTLWICGRALHNKQYQSIALSAYKAMYKRGINKLNIGTPTFCHGISGLLHLTHLMYIESHDTELLSLKNDLTEELMHYYDSENLLGFYDITYDNKKIVSIGALDGISGILNILNSISSKECPEWSFLYLSN